MLTCCDEEFVLIYFIFNILSNFVFLINRPKSCSHSNRPAYRQTQFYRVARAWLETAKKKKEKKHSETLYSSIWGQSSCSDMRCKANIPKLSFVGVPHSRIREWTNKWIKDWLKKRMNELKEGISEWMNKLMTYVRRLIGWIYDGNSGNRNEWKW